MIIKNFIYTKYYGDIIRTNLKSIFDKLKSEGIHTLSSSDLGIIIENNSFDEKDKWIYRSNTFIPVNKSDFYMRIISKMVNKKYIKKRKYGMYEIII